MTDLTPNMEVWAARWKAKHPLHALWLDYQRDGLRVEETRDWTEQDMIGWAQENREIHEAREQAVVALVDAWLSEHPGETTLTAQELVEMVRTGLQIGGLPEGEP